MKYTEMVKIAEENNDSPGKSVFSYSENAPKYYRTVGEDEE
jgi:hypothetical protein